MSGEGRLEANQKLHALQNTPFRSDEQSAPESAQTRALNGGHCRKHAGAVSPRNHCTRHDAVLVHVTDLLTAILKLLGLDSSPARKMSGTFRLTARTSPADDRAHHSRPSFAIPNSHSSDPIPLLRFP